MRINWDIAIVVMNIDEMPSQPSPYRNVHVICTQDISGQQLPHISPTKETSDNTQKKKRQLLGREILDHKENSGEEPDPLLKLHIYICIFNFK